jgi:hypothetical protein
MKHNQNSNKSTSKKLTLRLERIIQLSPLQLEGIQGASFDSCGELTCTKPQ